MSLAQAPPMDDTTPPNLRFVARLDIAVGQPVVVGPASFGERRMVPILGGTVRGPGLAGEVLPGGADHQILRADGVTDLEARYVLRLSDGALVYVVNRGLRHAAPEDMARLLRGEAVPPDRVYFRSSPSFETAAPQHAWLARTVCVATAERHPAQVVLRVFALG